MYVFIYYIFLYCVVLNIEAYIILHFMLNIILILYNNFKIQIICII